MNISRIIGRQYLGEEDDKRPYQDMPNKDIMDSIYDNVMRLATDDCTVSECVNAIADETGIDSDAKKRIKKHLEELIDDYPLRDMIHYEIKVLVEELTGLAIREPADNSEHDQNWEEL